MKEIRKGTPATFAGHGFDIDIDGAFRAEQATYLLNFLPETASAVPCGHVTAIRVHHGDDLFHRQLGRLERARHEEVVPFRAEPYWFSQVEDVLWWRPAPDSHLPQDHLYARDAMSRLHIVLRPGSDRGERYALRVIREVVLRCAEGRGWAAFHAAAAAVGGQGVLIAGPSGAGKTTVLTALAAHRQADLVGSDRCLLTEDAANVVGVPVSVRIAGGTLSALGPHDGLPPHELLPTAFGTPHKVSCTPHDFARAFAARVRETAPLRLVLLPQLRDDEHDLSLTPLRPAAAHEALSAACCTPYDEDWLHPWFADRTLGVEELARRAAELVQQLTATVPVLAISAGVHATHLLERIADAVTGRLP